jgi:hypothetical protein
MIYAHAGSSEEKSMGLGFEFWVSAFNAMIWAGLARAQ